MAKKKDTKFDDYLKANRKASREMSLEFASGFVSLHKTHKSKKNYNRKEKHSSLSF